LNLLDKKGGKMKTKSPSRSVMIAFLITVLLAGNNAIAVRFSNVEIPPFFGAAIRFAIAGLILFMVVLVMRLPLPRGRGLLGAMLFGVLGTGINFALMYWALEYLQAGMSMVILALVPLLTFLFACLHRQETFSWKSLGGSLLAAGGIVMIVAGQINIHVPILPVLGVVGAAACFAEATVIIKIYPQSHPITTNAVALSTGAVILFALSLIWKEHPVMPALMATWGSLAYLVIFGSVLTFVLTVYVIKNWTASAAAYQFVLFPFVTISVGAWLANETINTALLLGGGLVLLGVYIGGIAKTSQIKNVYRQMIARRRTTCPDC
jgi:drug/metabolite transporter (DMT)-like permease